MKKIILPLLGLLPLLTFAGGFQVNLQGNQQTGMGHLGTSFYLGASSAYFNPAMLGHGESKISVEAGANGITSYVIYQNQETGATAETDNPMGTPFHLYGSYRINDQITAGLAVYTPFGSSVVWGDDWDGKYLIQDISLSAIFIQPTFSIKASDKISVGLGLVYATGAFELNRAIAFQSSQSAYGQTNLKGNASGFGYNFGFHYKPTEKLNVGVTYRSGIKMALNGGDATFTAPKSTATNLPPTNKFDAELPLPGTTTIGLSYDVSEKLTVAIEYSRVAWDVYQSLDFDFETNTSALKDSKNARKYEASSIFRVGAQYKVNEKIIARAGAYYDQSPVQDEYFNPETPNTDNIGLTCGISYEISEKLSVDGSFLYIDGQERESYYTDPNNKSASAGGQNFGGKYKARSFIPGIGLRYNF
ncbi:MAG: hydrocarbon degradation protein [Bacteroidetes bacterium]|nr:MAG: hydrocarbon degradation protein [Bacteroidota bacterium]MBL1143405.1 hydrocarbon degradation protein [Bacteroidota bacterium]MCB0801472.1 outer membrane protein transport protein [Flavobacteriales bacterium]NOG56209.1 hydrocarbon degradation protein [Bacteroidota bacterium]